MLNKKTVHMKLKLLMLLIIIISTGFFTLNIMAKETIVFGDSGYDSIRFHSYVAGIIIEEGYGYDINMVTGSLPVILMGQRHSDIDVVMEYWTENIADIYYEAIEAGDIIEVGVNFNDNAQGFYVPAYVIEGDSERGIEPMAPDLKTVKDLADYWQLFEDEEDPSKGRIYGSPPGWVVDEIMRTKIKTYGLDEYYNYFSPGSDTALSAAIVAAYERGEAIVAYYWEPTWLVGMLDIILLEDEPYSEELWNNGYACEFQSMDITIGVNADIPNQTPELVEFLSKYHTNSELTSEALAYMMENDTDVKDAAIWFLKNKEDVWTQWVSEDVAQKVKNLL